MLTNDNLRIYVVPLRGEPCEEGRCWRYYISRAALAGRGAAVGSIARISAPQIETFVVKALSRQPDTGCETGGFGKFTQP